MRTEATAQLKAELRRRLSADRGEIGPQQRAAWSLAATARLQDVLAGLGSGPVALFSALPDEIDTGPAIDWLAGRGMTVLLPRQQAAGQPLAFHAYRRGDPLLPGPFGVLEPVPIAPRLMPSVVVTPLLAFDERGHRLGYGKGLYDRTLQGLRATGEVVAIGFAFEMQRVDAVPTGPDDELLDVIVTDAAVRHCRSQSGRDPIGRGLIGS